MNTVSSFQKKQIYKAPLVRMATILLVSLSFTASLLLTAFETSVISAGETFHYEEFAGYEVLFIGWIGLIEGTVAWYANPLLLFGLAFMKRHINGSLFCSLLGFLLAISSLNYKSMWIDEKFARTADVNAWGIGFYIWLLSFAILFLGAFLISINNQKNITNDTAI